MSNLHPIFQAVVATIAPPSVEERVRAKVSHAVHRENCGHGWASPWRDMDADELRVYIAQQRAIERRNDCPSAPWYGSHERENASRARSNINAAEARLREVTS